jgi:hypothetical protein
MKPTGQNESVIPNVESEPRRKVKDLMRRLVKAAAFGSAALGLAAAESACPIVCDPLPPPMTCPNPTHNEVLDSMSFQAEWASADAAGPEGHLSVSFFGRGTVTYSNVVTLTGATLVGTPVVGSGTVDLRFVPDSGVTAVTAAVNYTCTGSNGPGSGTLTLRLDVSSTPSVNQTIPVTLELP